MGQFHLKVKKRSPGEMNDTRRVTVFGNVSPGVHTSEESCHRQGRV